MLKEFKKFISRGNVLDLAVGVVIGGAFSNIVTALVDNIIMPLVGIIIGGIDFSSLAITINDANIQYGLFIQNVVNFLIIAFCIFLVVKAFNKITRKKEEVAAKGADILLLEEIRDLLKDQKPAKKETKTEEKETKSSKK